MDEESSFPLRNSDSSVSLLFLFYFSVSLSVWNLNHQHPRIPDRNRRDNAHKLRCIRTLFPTSPLLLNLSLSVKVQRWFSLSGGLFGPRFRGQKPHYDSHSHRLRGRAHSSSFFFCIYVFIFRIKYEIRKLVLKQVH